MLGEIDALGHRVLKRMGTGPKMEKIDTLVGLAMCRRAVTQFVGARHLFNASSVEPAKLALRAQFETMLAVRYLVHGGKRNVHLFLKSSPRAREARARYFYVGAERRELVSRYAMIGGHWGRVPVIPGLNKKIRKETEATEKELKSQFKPQMKRFGPLATVNASGKKRYNYGSDWYSFGFPGGKVSTVRGLAKRLGFLWEYEVLYGAFSGLMHPRGIRHDISIEEGNAHVFHPYLPSAFPFLGVWSARWQQYALSFLVKAYSPESLADAQAVHTKLEPTLTAVPIDLPEGLV